MSELESFRRETRAWLEANCPAEMRRPVASESDACWGGRHFKFQSDAQRRWLQIMGERGWTVPTWPKAYGGGGLSKEEGAVLDEEMRALGCRPPLDSFGIWMLGPALLAVRHRGAEAEHLPKIARGEIRWCQGYSEPGAGSDLASLRTRPRSRATTSCQRPENLDFLRRLGRLDFLPGAHRPTAKKHEGISFLLFDMESPGVSTRPIVLISGESPFCETFFDDVLVPKANLVGELNEGWDHRQIPAHARARNDRRHRRAVESQTARTSLPRDRRSGCDRPLPEALLRAQIARMNRRGGVSPADAGHRRPRAPRRRHPAHVLRAQILRRELNKRRWELMISAAGADGLEWEGERSNDAPRAPGCATKAIRSKAAPAKSS